MDLEGGKPAIGYPDRLVGTDLDVALQKGEVLALLGPNGGGKTTLLKTLLGLIAPKAGTVHCGGRGLCGYAVRERARILAYVPQSHVPTFAFTVESVVLMGRTAHGTLFSRPSAHDRAVAARVLEQFGIPHLTARPPTPVSGGGGVGWLWGRARGRGSRNWWCPTSRPRASTSATRVRSCAK